MKSEPRKFIPFTVEGEDFPSFMLPEDSDAVQLLLDVANKTGRDLSEVLNELIIKHFTKLLGMKYEDIPFEDEEKLKELLRNKLRRKL